MAAAWSVVLGTLPGEGEAASMPEAMSAVERVVSREDLAAAVEAVAELLPQGSADGDDGDAEWRAALTDRYATVRPFIDMLASAVPWGCTEAGGQVIAALRALLKLMAARQ